jgi:hypothetical protein
VARESARRGGNERAGGGGAGRGGAGRDGTEEGRTRKKQIKGNRARKKCVVCIGCDWRVVDQLEILDVGVSAALAAALVAFWGSKIGILLCPNPAPLSRNEASRAPRLLRIGRGPRRAFQGTWNQLESMGAVDHASGEVRHIGTGCRCRRRRRCLVARDRAFSPRLAVHPMPMRREEGLWPYHDHDH